MKLIIDISEDIYNDIVNYNLSLTKVDELCRAVVNGTPLEAQSNRCDSCTHSEEQNGSNCYECVKGMADNFEAQPTDAVSRQAVIDHINLYPKIIGNRSDLVLEIKHLPPVTPQIEPCEDAVSRTLVHEAITASIAESENPYEMWQRIEALPSVTPSRKNGKWIEAGRQGGKLRIRNDRI